MVHNHIKRQVCADGAPEPRTCGVAVSRVSGSRWDARRISRSGIFWRMTPGFFALPRGRMMSPTSPRGQTSTCSPPKVHTSTHYHHLVGVKRPQITPAVPAGQISRSRGPAPPARMARSASVRGFRCPLGNRGINNSNGKLAAASRGPCFHQPIPISTVSPSDLDEKKVGES